MDEPNPLHLQAYFEAAPPASGLPKSFAILTACNPTSRPAPPDDNARADAELAAVLPAEKRRHFRVTGRARDGSHREPGVGIAASSPEEIRPVSRQFRQEAFFWVEDGTVYVMNTEGTRRHLVGAWKDRLL